MNKKLIIKRKSLTQKNQNPKMEELEIGKLEGLEVKKFFCWRSTDGGDAEAEPTSHGMRVLKSWRPEFGNRSQCC